MRPVLLAGLAGAALLAGCMLVTGSTDGYAPQPSPFQCQAPKDCAAQGQVCCYTLDQGAPASQCQTSCPSAFQQACSVPTDCGDGGSCVVQFCTPDGGSTMQVSTCGAIPDICAQ